MYTENEAPKKQLKSDINRISVTGIVNSLIMMVVFTVSIVVRLIAAMMKSDISDATQFLDKVIEDNEFWETVAKSGMEYLLFSLLGV